MKPDETSGDYQPLAERLRPQTLDEFVGQSQLVGEGAALRQALLAGRIHSMVLWGPPGTGKTLLAKAIANETFPNYRQLLAVDRNGNTHIHSGKNSLGIWTDKQGINCAAGGNLLADLGVPLAMITSFENTKGALGDRLIAAMQSGLNAGGEAGPLHSAGLLIVDTQDWPYAELRCDWTEDCPIMMIANAWQVYKPQAKDYITRALDPTAAPSYGVPGDE